MVLLLYNRTVSVPAEMIFGHKWIALLLGPGELLRYPKSVMVVSLAFRYIYDYRTFGGSLGVLTNQE